MLDIRQKVDAAISHSEVLFGSDHWLWPKPIIDVLEGVKRGTGLEWALSIFRGSLRKHLVCSNVSEQSIWLEEIAKLIGRDNIASHCEERALIAWYHDDNLQLINHAISRLYKALTHFERGEEFEYLGTIAKSIKMLANIEDRNDWKKCVYDRSVEEFIAYASRPTDGYLREKT